MAKKDDRLTLPEQTRIPSEVKRELIETAEADFRPLSDHIVYLLVYGLQLRRALLGKEVSVRVSQLSSGNVIRIQR
jgi:hypothetical protein